MTLAKPWEVLGVQQDGLRHSIVASIQQLGNEEVEVIAGREREQRFLMAGVAMSSCNNKHACMYGTRLRTLSHGHVAACSSTPSVLTCMNIIKWVCYFSQGCATVVYASTILSLSLCYNTLDTGGYRGSRTLSPLISVQLSSRSVCAVKNLSLDGTSLPREQKIMITLAST